MTRRAVLLLIVLVALNPAHADPKNETQGKLHLVERWLHAAGFGTSFQDGLKTVVAEEHKSNAFLNALLAVPPERIESIVAPTFAKRLTLAEAETVAKFNDSATGRAMNAQVVREAAGADLVGQKFAVLVALAVTVTGCGYVTKWIGFGVRVSSSTVGSSGSQVKATVYVPAGKNAMV